MGTGAGLLPATRWQKALFVLPALLLTIAIVIFPTIFAVLLPRYRIELTQPPATYRNDHSKMVVQLAQPCGARMRPR